MNRNFVAGGALAGLVVAGGSAGMVSAQTVADRTGLTEAQVIEIALQEIPTEAAAADRERPLGAVFFDVDILGPDGGEIAVEIDMETGETLQVNTVSDGCNKSDANDQA